MEEYVWFSDQLLLHTLRRGDPKLITLPTLCFMIYYIICFINNQEIWLIFIQYLDSPKIKNLNRVFVLPFLIISNNLDFIILVLQFFRPLSSRIVLVTFARNLKLLTNSVPATSLLDWVSFYIWFPPPPPGKVPTLDIYGQFACQPNHAIPYQAKPRCHRKTTS